MIFFASAVDGMRTVSRLLESFWGSPAREGYVLKVLNYTKLFYRLIRKHGVSGLLLPQQSKLNSGVA